jgi:hypothetical protein
MAASGKVGFAAALIASLCIGAIIAFRTWFDHHEGTAAWVQAVGAIAVIIATAWIANANFTEERRRSREAERHLWESIAVLSTNCLKCFDSVLKAAKTVEVNREGFAQCYVPSDFEAPLEGLAAIPLHQIGRVDLLTAVINLRRTMGRAKTQLDRFQDQLDRSPVFMIFDVANFRSRRTELFNIHADITRLVLGSTAAVESELSRLASDPL